MLNIDSLMKNNLCQMLWNIKHVMQAFDLVQTGI